jgi:hypothetical protein
VGIEKYIDRKIAEHFTEHGYPEPWGSHAGGANALKAVYAAEYTETTRCDLCDEPALRLRKTQF